MEKDEKIIEQKDELGDMIRAYNTLERERMSQLKKIFYAMKQGQGHRKVVFASDALFSNCWGGPDALDYKAYLKPLDATILEIERGGVKTKF